MAKSEAQAARAPRGTKPVSQAFFAALEHIPEATRAAVGKAALTMIRDELKSRKEKLKLAAAKEKEKARRSAAPAPVSKAPAAKPVPAKAAASKVNNTLETAAPAKRRARKVADVPSNL